MSDVSTDQEVLVAHANARLNLYGRRLLVERGIEDGRPVAHVAKGLGVSRQCARGAPLPRSKNRCCSCASSNRVGRTGAVQNWACHPERRRMESPRPRTWPDSRSGAPSMGGEGGQDETTQTYPSSGHREVTSGGCCIATTKPRREVSTDELLARRSTLARRHLSLPHPWAYSCATCRQNSSHVRR
jgi:hypothetical protein